MADVLVVGGSAIDLKAIPMAPLVAETSNPGFIDATPGGVGRNIAETVARLGTDVRLVSRVGEDAFGKVVRDATRAAGVDVTFLEAAAERTATYLATLDVDGSLSVAVADFAAIDTMTPEHLPEEAFDGVRYVVLDANLPLRVIAAALSLAHERSATTIIEPVSVAKAARLAGLHQLGLSAHLITPNEDEYAALEARVDPGLIGGIIALRRGANGTRIIDHATQHDPPKEPIDIPAVEIPPEFVRDVTGAGDAATAGLVHALSRGLGLPEAVAFGHTIAAHTVQSAHTVAPDIADLGSHALPPPEEDS